MASTARVESPVLFYLPEDTLSQPPNIIAEVKTLVENSIACHPLTGIKDKTRSASGDLLVQSTHPAGLAILSEWSAPYASKFGRDSTDLPYLIKAISNSGQYLDGIFVNIPYIELRDDRWFRNAPPRADVTAEMLADLDNNYKIIGFALWDPHSALGVDLLNDNFARKNREIRLHCFTALPLFAGEFRKNLDIENHRDDYIVVAVDLGGLHRSMLLANELNLPVAFFDKTRPEISDVVFGNLYVAGINGLSEEASFSILRGKKAILVDDLFFTTKSAAEGAIKLKDDYSLSEVHFAATHAAYIMPEAEKNLGYALRRKVIDSAYTTNTLPTCHMIEGVKVLSLAEPMALVLKVAGGLATPSEIAQLDRYYYDPGPTKEALNNAFNRGELDLTPEDWPWLHPPNKMPETGLIYYYWRGREKTL